MGGKTATISNSEQRLLSLQVQQSSQGLTLPVVYGRTRIAGNLIWYGDFAALEHKTVTRSGKGGGGVKQVDIKYDYEAAVALALCEGEIQGVTAVWRDKEKFTRLADLGLTLQNGSHNQPVWGHLQTKHPDQALSYSDTAYVYGATYRLTKSAQIHSHNFEVAGKLAYSEHIPDANPRDVLVDLLTNPNYGCGFPAENLADTDVYSTYCRALGLFVSPAYAEQNEAQQVLSELLEQTHSAAVFSEGRLKIIPYGDAPASGNGAVYVPNLTPVYDLTDDDYIVSGADDPVRCERKAAADAYNQVQIEYLDRSNDYNIAVAEAKDQANIEKYGLRPKDAVKMHAVCDKAVAQRIAQLLLQRGLYVRNEYEFKLGWKYVLLEPMDLVTLTDAGLGLDKTPVRIIEIDEDADGMLTVRAEDFPFGAASATTYPTQGNDGYAADYNVAPQNTYAPAIFEAPLQLTNGEPQIWLAASGGEHWGGCEVWVSGDGDSYVRAGSIHQKARYGSLTAPLPAGAVYDNANGAAVQLLSGSLQGVSENDARDMLSACLVGNEFLAFADAELTGVGQYRLSKLVRGAWGSAPESHAAGTRFVRVDDALFRHPFSPEQMGKTVYIKLISFNIFGAALQDLSEVPAYPYTIVGAPLGQVSNLRLTSEWAWGKQCALAWDKLDGADSYDVEVYAANSQNRLRLINGVVDNRYTYTLADMQADGGQVRDVVFKVRGRAVTGKTGKWTQLVARNPQLKALQGIELESGLKQAFFKCTAPQEDDFAGLLLWVSEQADCPAVPENLAYDGADTFVVISKCKGQPLQGGKTYYVRAAGYDSFDKQQLNISSSHAFTVYEVNAIAKELSESNLAGSLKERIGKIDGNGAGSVNARIAEEARTRAQSIAAEAQARAAAIREEMQARNAEIRREADKQTAALRAESGKLNTAITSAAQTARSELTAQVAKLTAKDGELQRAQTALDGKAAELTRTAQQLGNRVTAAETVNREQATAIQTVTAAQGRTAAALENEKTARAQGDAAEARARETLAATVGQHTAALSAERQARIDGDAANTRELTAAKSRIADAVSSIGRLEQTVTNNREAAATAVSELRASFGQASGANLLPNANFETLSGSLPTGWTAYNNNRAAQPETVTRVDGGADKSRAIRIAWTGRNGSTKGIYTSIAAWDKGEYYILAVCARVPEGQPQNGKIVLHYSNAPSWRDIEYLAQPTLSRNWQWTVMRARKPVQDSGTFSQLFISVDGSYTGEAVEYCLPYASKGEMWTGYKPADMSAGVAAVEAALQTERETRANADTVLTRELNTAKSRLQTAEAALQTEARTRAEADRAEAQARQTLAGKVDGNTAAIAAVREAKADKTQVGALARQTLSAEWQRDIATAKTQAQQAASQDAQRKADAARQAAERAAAEDAQTKAAAAQAAAQAAASAEIRAAKEAAAADAQRKVDAARTAAASAAETADRTVLQQAAREAQAKADAAKRAAETAASADATAKANAAKAQAIADAAAKDAIVKREAAADAQAKADAVRRIAEAAQRAADTVAADLVREQQTRAAGDEANAREITATKARLGTAESNIGELRQTTARQNQALAEAQNSLTARLNVADTRNDNQPPSWYWANHPRQSVREFKFLSVIGISGGGTYGLLQTDIAWSDPSGGKIEQRATDERGNVWRRYSDVAYVRDNGLLHYIKDVWTEWAADETVAGAQAKADAVREVAEAAQRAAQTVDATLTEYKRTQAATDAAQTDELRAAKSQIGQQTAALEQIRSTKADKSEVSAQLQTTLQAAARDAQTKADAAKAAAERTAQIKADAARQAAEQAAAADAQSKVAAAQAATAAEIRAAKEAAAADAQRKADAARTAAASAAETADRAVLQQAAREAQAKADAAKRAAETAASADATAKAAAAEARAKADAAAKDAVLKREAAADASTKAETAKNQAIAEAQRLNTAANARINELQNTIATNREAAATAVSELRASFGAASGANLLPNAHFAVWTGVAPSGWGIYNNGRATQPETVTRVDDGVDKSPAIRIVWTGRNGSTKGIYTSAGAWDKGEYYILAVCARVPDGQPENGKIVLHYSNAPSWQDVEYLAQPTLSRNWQWTVMRARKPVQDSGTFSQLFISVDGSYTGEAVEYCLPYASKGGMWAGYKPADLSAGVSAVEAALQTERETRATADNAQTAEITAAKSQIGNNTAAIDGIRSTKADKSEVAALARTSLASEWTAAAQTAAQTAKTQAVQAAASDAQAKATAAQRAAEQAAERLATAKANAAQAAATAAASGDAQRKADAAKAAAITDAAAKDEAVKRAAAADAQQKADAAKQAAIAEANRLNTATNARVNTLEQTVSTQNSAVASRFASVEASVQTAKNEAINAYKIQDTRDDNRPPSWYRTHYRQRTVEEFKKATAIGLAGSGGTFVHLQTAVKWYDATGGAVHQSAVGDNGKRFARYSVGDNWSAWSETETVAGAQAKIDSERTARVAADETQTRELAAAKSRLGAAESGISELRQTVTRENSATATQIRNLTATVEQNRVAAELAKASVDGNVLHIAAPEGGGFAAGGTSTGAIKIRLPVRKTSTMIKFRVEIFDYATEKAASYEIAGYNYGSGLWYHPTVVMSGAAANTKNVRFGHDAEKDCVWIGELNSTWSYLKVRVADLVAGHSGHTAANWQRGWQISVVTAFDTVQHTRNTLNPAKDAAQALADIATERTARVNADNALTREVNTAKAQIGTANSQITALQSTVAANHRAQSEQVNTLTARLDNLQIGGRNYVLASDRSTANYLNFAVSPDLTADKVRGQTLTVSCDIVCQSVRAGSRNRIGAEVRVEYADGTSAYVNAWRNNAHSAGDFKGRITGSLKLADKPVRQIHALGIYNQTGGGTATVARPKLEIGSVATDWLPAPEDGATAAQIQAVQNALAEKDRAHAQQIQTVQTTLNGMQSSVQTAATSINGLKAQYTVKVDANGHVAGYGLASEPVNGRPRSKFIVQADQFGIGATGKSTAYPFVVDTRSNTIGVNGALVVNGKAIVDKLNAGDINGAKIAANSITANHLKARSISGDKLAVTSLSAISSNLGTVTAGSLNIGGRFVVNSDGRVRIGEPNNVGTVLEDRGVVVYNELGDIMAIMGRTES